MAYQPQHFQPGEIHPDGALEHGLLEGHPGQSNRFVPLLLVAAIAASGLSMLFSIGTAMASAGAKPDQALTTPDSRPAADTADETTGQAFTHRPDPR